jgi:hypothetical protein
MLKDANIASGINSGQQHHGHEIRHPTWYEDSTRRTRRLLGELETALFTRKRDHRSSVKPMESGCDECPPRRIDRSLAETTSTMPRRGTNNMSCQQMIGMKSILTSAPLTAQP